ncbi:MAG: hypothetical protein JNL74_09635 [Fibrobacteres bacterium]|nr:hypothetical protein [Fibrobacterota bacterium]
MKIKTILLLAYFLFSSGYSALTAIAIKVSVEKNDTVLFNPVIKDLDSTVKTVTLEVVTNPDRGTISLIDSISTYKGTKIPGFKYIPSPNFTGTDSFSWKVFNGTTSSNVTTCKIKIHPREPENSSIILIVNDSLYTKITTEVQRLKNDLMNEGYNSEIKLWPNHPTSTHQFPALHDTLMAAYEKEDHFLSGAILIGMIPLNYDKISQDDSPLWCMSQSKPGSDSTIFGLFGRNATHIWVSRMFSATLVWGSPVDRADGDQATLMKRLLQANHDYRTGASRMPYTAFYFNSLGGNQNPNALLEVWPRIKAIAPTTGNGYPDLKPYFYSSAGGELFEIGQHLASIPAEAVVPFRVYLSSSCNTGSLSGPVNSHLLTRGGSCVLGVGPYDPLGTRHNLLSIADTTAIKKRMRTLLKNGCRWGDAWIKSGMETVRIGFHGDLSIRPMMSLENSMPIVKSDTFSGVSPYTADLSVNATDTDGTIDNYEWFAETYQSGKAAPDKEGVHATSLQHTFIKPYHYQTRVEVIDNFKARTVHSVIVNVAPDSKNPMRVRCGFPSIYRNFKETFYDPSQEYTDPKGQLWFHNQLYYKGTWGMAKNYPAFATTSAITGTDNPKAFSSWVVCSYMWDYFDIAYKIPLSNGKYTLRLGFADFTSTTSAGDTSTMDIDVEGKSWKQTFCPFTLVGAKTAVVIETTLTVTDSMMEFAVKKSALKPSRPYLNNFEIIPINGNVSAESATDNLKEELTVSPNPFNPTTNISLRLKIERSDLSQQDVVLKIIDCGGRIVSSQKIIPASNSNYLNRNMTWSGLDRNGNQLASGIYQLIVTYKERKMSRKLFLVR